MWRKKDKAPIISIVAGIILVIFIVCRSESIEDLVSSFSGIFTTSAIFIVVSLVISFFTDKNIFHDNDEKKK